MDFGFLKAQPAQPTLDDPVQIKSMYKHWRLRSMYATFIGYAVYYFCRKNLSAATPALIAEFGYTKTAIGGIWSAMYLTYGISKLFNGILGDRSNPRYFMAIGLFLSAITNIVFGFSASLGVLGVTWALNGCFQAMGGPASARVITHWFSSNELGTKWGIWNVSHQVGGGVIMVLAGTLTQYYGWRSAFFVPAAIGILCGFFLINRLRDTPEAMGLPSIEDYRNDHTTSLTGSGSEPLTTRQLLFDVVLKSREIWLLALANFFVYIVRYGTLDWVPTYLVEVKHSSIAAASWKASLLEFMGIVGSLLAGWFSDRYFPNHRSLLNVLYMVLLAFSIFGFWYLPPGHPAVEAALIGSVGFLIYGPQMLIGVCAADAAGKRASATANGMTGLFGYMGSIVSGIGTGWAVEHFGWGGGFGLFVGASILGALLCLGTQIHVGQQRQTEYAKMPA